MNKIRIPQFSILILVLLISATTAFAAEGSAEIGSVNQAHCNFTSEAYSASGEFIAENLSESATLESLEESALLAVCLETLALPESTGNFSGDDAYDQAAGGLG